jgi:hypothetical protein
MGTVAEAAAQFFTDRLGRIGSEVGNKVEDVAVSELYGLIDRKLRHGRSARPMADGADRPEDRKADLRGALEEAVATDEAFRDEVTGLLRQLNLLQYDSSTHAVGQTTHLGAGARVARTVIAAGSVDQSRRTWKSSSALPLVVAILVVAALGGVGGVFVLGDRGKPPINGSAVDPEHVGTDPGEGGLREAHQALVRAYAARDARTACLLLSPGETILIAGRCESAMSDELDKYTKEKLQSFANCQITSIKISNDEGYPAAAVKDCENVDKPYKADRWTYETGRWLYDGETSWSE